MKNLTTAVFAKCAVGTSLYTAVGGRIYKGRAPETTVYPYVVFFVVTDVPGKTFTEDYEDVLFQFSLFSSTSGTTEVENMFTYLKALYDECSLTITGNTLVWMKRGNATLLAEEHTTASGTTEVWHYAVDYSILMSKN